MTDASPMERMEGANLQHQGQDTWAGAGKLAVGGSMLGLAQQAADSLGAARSQPEKSLGGAALTGVCQDLWQLKRPSHVGRPCCGSELFPYRRP